MDKRPIISLLAALAGACPGALGALPADPADDTWKAAPAHAVTASPGTQLAAANTDRSAIPIVYSWSERTTHGTTVNGSKISDKAISAFDPLPEVARIYNNFKEANLVYRDAAGNETTLFDCIGDKALHCAALDGRVSPDGRKIAYWVVYAKKLRKELWTLHGTLPIHTLQHPLKAEIRIHDLNTGETNTWKTPRGRFDLHPEWLSNDRLIFVSNRARVHPVYLPGKDPVANWALQRHTANIDGSGVVNIGPHDDLVLHPYVLSDGNIISANIRVDEELGRGKTTIHNQWWMTMTDQFGGNETTIFGAHGQSYRATHGHSESLLALHFYGERSNGDLLATNYYRRRHVGGQGQILVIERLPHGVEGAGSSFSPRVTPLNPYGQEEDNPTRRDPRTGRFYGKASYPVGLPGGQIMLVYASGYCYELELDKANDAYLKGGPGCDTGIYRTTRIPSRHPSDFIKIVDNPDRHEFSPDIALPYQQVYGKPMPEQQSRRIQRDAAGAPQCTLQVVDAKFAKLFRPDSKRPCHELGGACIQRGYRVKKDLAALAIYQTQINRVSQHSLERGRKPIPGEGHVTTLLGYAFPEKDGSLAVTVPCETPIKMRGVTRDGKIFIRDQIKHSLRQGETRRCIGCHGGHTEKGYQAKGGMDAWQYTIAAGKPPQHLTRELQTGAATKP